MKGRSLQRNLQKTPLDLAKWQVFRLDWRGPTRGLHSIRRILNMPHSFAFLCTLCKTATEHPGTVSTPTLHSASHTFSLTPDIGSPEWDLRSMMMVITSMG
jgi:hypothetical protein